MFRGILTASQGGWRVVGGTGCKIGSGFDLLVEVLDLVKINRFY